MTRLSEGNGAHRQSSNHVLVCDMRQQSSGIEIGGLGTAIGYGRIEGNSSASRNPAPRINLILGWTGWMQASSPKKTLCIFFLL